MLIKEVFTENMSSRGLSKKELEDLRKKEEEEAAAHVRFSIYIPMHLKLDIKIFIFIGEFL